MKKQTQAIHLEYERRDAYDSLSVPVYNTLAYEFDNAAIMSEAFTDKIKAPDYSRVENPTVTNLERRVAALTDAAHATAAQVQPWQQHQHLKHSDKKRYESS